MDEYTSKPISKAKFTCIWRFDNNEWKLARTTSYNHIPHRKIRLNTEVLILYEVNYQSSNRMVRIKKEGETLKMIDLIDNKKVRSSEMLAETQDTFYLNQNDIQIKFIQKQGQVDKLVVYENGTQIEEIKYL